MNKCLLGHEETRWHRLDSELREYLRHTQHIFTADISGDSLIPVIDPLSKNFRPFSSVAQSCPSLCSPINRSMPGLPVNHQLPEFRPLRKAKVFFPESFGPWFFFNRNNLQVRETFWVVNFVPLPMYILYTHTPSYTYACICICLSI